MTAKVLQLVNSAFFGLRRHVASPAQAAALLGLDTLKALVLSVQVFKQFSSTKMQEFSMDALWTHSVTVGTFAQAIAKAENQTTKLADDALMAGLLHDCGKLLLAVNLPKRFCKTIKMSSDEVISNVEAEIQILGTTHAEVGAYLLGLWGLQDPIVEALAFHHHPSSILSHDFSPLTAVHLANIFAHEFKEEQKCPLPQIDYGYLKGINRYERIDILRELCYKIFISGENSS
jgi:HD-like signal output (HDOD) protein